MKKYAPMLAEPFPVCAPLKFIKSNERGVRAIKKPTNALDESALVQYFHREWETYRGVGLATVFLNSPLTLF